MFSFMACGARPKARSRTSDAALTRRPLGHTVPDGDEWAHEVKRDGWRLQAHKEGATARLYSRPGNDISERFPAIAEAVARLPRRSLILDGELVAIGDDSRPDFHLMRKRRPPAVAWLFDLLMVDDNDLRRHPWKERRRLLERLMARNKSPILQVSEVFDDGAALLRLTSLGPFTRAVSQWASRLGERWAKR